MSRIVALSFIKIKYFVIINYDLKVHILKLTMQYLVYFFNTCSLIELLLLSTVFPVYTKTYYKEAVQNEIAGYFQNWDSQNAPWIHPKNIDSRYTIIMIAFAMPVSNLDMTMTFSPVNISEQELKNSISQLKAKGKKVLISIGGHTANYSFPNDAEKQVFVSSINEIMDTYDFDGIDIAIGHGDCIEIKGGTIANSENASQIRLIEAIKSIMDHHRKTKRKKMMLTMAPETAFVQGGQSSFGGIWGGYLPIIHALRDSLDILQVPLFNSGTMYGIDRNIYTQGNVDFIVAMTEAVIQGFSTGGGYFYGIPANKVAIGLPACIDAVSGGYVDSVTIVEAMSYLRGKGSKTGSYSMVSRLGYPNLRGTMTWSINWQAKGVSSRNAIEYIQTEVKIGNQIWMSKNLDVDRFRNGDPIPQAQTEEEWVNAGENGQPAWRYIANNPKNDKVYNWYAVNNPRGLEPIGFHIPTKNEWKKLVEFLVSDDPVMPKVIFEGKVVSNPPPHWNIKPLDHSGKKMKSTSGWGDYFSHHDNYSDGGQFKVTPSGNGSNSSGFSGLPFSMMGKVGKWWSCTENSTHKNHPQVKYPKYYAWSIILESGKTDAYIYEYEEKKSGLFVRCIKD